SMRFLTILLPAIVAIPCIFTSDDTTLRWRLDDMTSELKGIKNGLDTMTHALTGILNSLKTNEGLRDELETTNRVLNSLLVSINQNAPGGIRRHNKRHHDHHHGVKSIDQQ
ncbi:hypothetical protein PMAYCL1PPCAC_11573, partial [Pristionchus mayeri]